MFEYEKKLEEAKERGVKISSSLSWFIETSRLAGLDIVENLGDGYILKAFKAKEPEKVMDIMKDYFFLTEVAEHMDRYLCGVIDRCLEEEKEKQGSDG